MNITAQRIDRELKAWPAYFADLMAGLKTFEVRKRDPIENVYLPGELLRLREYHPTNGYTGREITVKVTYVCPLDPIGCLGYDAMTVALLPEEEEG